MLIVGKSVSETVRMDLCVSCGICKATCPCIAIKMVFSQGQYLPFVSDSCIECGMCLNICPGYKVNFKELYEYENRKLPIDIFRGYELSAYIGYTKDIEIRKKSTSGGIITSLIVELLKSGLYKGAFILPFDKVSTSLAKIVYTENIEEILSASKSKYLPASVENVVSMLKCKTKSIIVGTPCQIHGIKKYCIEKGIDCYQALFLGLFCEKTLNYHFLDFYQWKYGRGKDIVGFDYRNKEKGGWPGHTKLSFEKGKKKYVDRKVRMSLKSYFQLHRCLLCIDKFNQLSDISIGDCYVKGEETELGQSNIIVRTEKGQKVIADLEDKFVLKKINPLIIVESQKIEEKKANLVYCQMLAEKNKHVIYPGIQELKMMDIKRDKVEKGYNKSLTLIYLGRNPAGFSQIESQVRQGRIKTLNHKLNRLITKAAKMTKKITVKTKSFIREIRGDKSLFIEIRKAGFINKGAELMLRSIIQRIHTEYPNAKLVMAPSPDASYEKRAQLGLYQKLYYRRYHIQWAFFGSLIPRFIRSQFGLVLDRELDVVLDAAGFSYSDQWGPQSTIELAKYIQRWKQNGTKVILLPQAFGPFTSTKIKKAIRIVADHADLIFPRENTSYKYLVDVVGERENISIAPDFTNIMEGIVPDSFDQKNNKFCIVPNYRMKDKTPKEISEAYLPFLVFCARYLLEKQARPFFLIHEGENDYLLANEVSSALDSRVPIVRETDPIKIKGILGTCNGTIGSRFHGLVSALSQGVPSLATGWSHKYRELFEDYGFPEGLIDIQAPEHMIKEKIDMLLDIEKSIDIKRKLLRRSEQIKKMVYEMWDKIFEVILKN